MRLRVLLAGGAALGLALMASPAAAQIRPVAPIAPVPVAPVPITPMPLRPVLPNPVSPVPHVPIATPVPTVPTPTPAVPTRPEPPVVRHNPPVLPTRHDDGPKEEDPFWMSKALDKVNKERKDWNVTYDLSQVPSPPPPLNIPTTVVPPASKESSGESKVSNWVMLAAILAGCAFALGRATRRR